MNHDDDHASLPVNLLDLGDRPILHHPSIRRQIPGIVRTTTNQSNQRTEWLGRGVAAIRARFKIFRIHTVVTPTHIATQSNDKPIKHHVMPRAQVEFPSLETRVRRDGTEGRAQKPLRARPPN